MTFKQLIRRAAFSVLACSTLFAQNYTFTTFSVRHPPVNGTQANSINNRGIIVGSFGFDRNRNQVTRGFKRYLNGDFESPIIAPGDVKDFTSAQGINDSGVIVGRYLGADNRFHGFLDDAGNFTTIDEGGGPNTWVMGINNRGDFAGVFGDSIPPQHGFISVNGVVTQIDVPGAVTTQVIGIAWDDTVVGVTVKGVTPYGFLRGPKGNIRLFTIPGAAVPEPLAVNNDSASVVGDYQDASGHFHGFLIHPLPGSSQGAGDVEIIQATTVDYPGSFFTEVTGINSQGVITGWEQSLDSHGNIVTFGFFGTPNPQASANAEQRR